MSYKTDTLTSTANTVANTLGFPWLLILILSLFLVIGLLTWLLIKKEKALQLIGFSISPIGLKLTYELNTEEKIRILAIENMALQKEILLMKTEIKKVNYTSFKILLVLLVILAFEKVKINKNENKQAKSEPKIN